MHLKDLIHLKNLQKPCVFVRALAAWCAFSLAIASAAWCNFTPTIAAQTNSQASLTESEKREAQELSVAFTKRLGESLDFEVVMREFFMPDAVEQYIAIEKKRAAKESYPWVILGPGIFVDVRLLDKAPADNWRKLYVEVNNFLLLGLVHGLQQKIDFEKLKPTDLYPAAALQLLDRNPLLKNFVLKKSGTRNFTSVADMQSAAVTLEQANELTRKGIQPINLEEAVLRMAMHNAPAAADLSKIHDQIIHAELENSADFPGLTSNRPIMVTALSLQGLLLAKSNGKLKIVWAYFLGG